MARSYTNRSTAIWREDDFRALTAVEQHVLFLIESQPDISAAGTLPLTLKRWAAMFKGGSIVGVREALAGLEDAGRVVVDDDTEELLVVSFIVDDRAHGNTKRSPVILRAAGEVVSLRLRRALAVQFERVGLPLAALALPPEPGGPSPSRGADNPSDRHADSLSPDPVETDESPEADYSYESGPEEENSQVDRLSDSLSDGVSRIRGTVVGKGEYLSASVHNPHLSVPSPAPNAPRGAAGLVANALGIDDDETREVLDQIRKIHKPRNLSGYVRTMADNGDLDAVLDLVRRDKARRDAILARQASRAAVPVAEPPPSTVTPEQAAAERVALRQFLAGRGPAPGGDPMRLGDVIGKAASA